MLAITMLLGVTIYFYVNKYDNSFIISYMVLLTLGVMRVMPLFNSIVTALNKIQYKKYSILAILDLLKSKSEILEKDTELDKNFKKINFKNLIQINELSFKIDDNKILDDLNFQINKGEKICIIGESGSGKTTLINILCGLLRAPVNKYLIDDATIIHDNIYKLRKIVSIMPQESFLINDSIRNNICFGENNNIKDLENIYEITNLKNLIKNFPDGDNQIISENGSNISGGEKQRILIARSLYKNFDILILDEPISSLDSNNSYEIISNILKKYKEKTIIIITHKIDKTIKFDKTFVIKNGKLQN